MLEGRTALVTGSTRGIGWAVAREFARHGATVLLNAHRDPESLEERAAALREEFGTEAKGLLFDVADGAAVKQAYRRIFEEHRRLDVLVNNAGVLSDALVGMISDDVIERTLAVNTVGVIHNLQAAARLMMRAGGGSIVNVSSIIGTQGNKGQVVYAASKSAVLGITRSAAKELAPRGIRVNAVAPGFIRTDMIAHLPEPTVAERLAGIHMGRIGEPEDVARAILFFASDLSTYVTGQVLGVDGGMVI